MSSIYRFVVFDPGKQPTVEEVARLDAWSSSARQRYAVGINAEDGCLALVFSAAGFDAAISGDSALAQLVRHWRVRGCEVQERLRFIKKADALQPIPGGMLYGQVEQRSEPTLRRKQLAAQEALGRAGLKFQQTLEQQAWLGRLAKGVPYALMGLCAVLTIVAGVYFGRRLQDADAERRRDTIERVSSDAMDEQLARQAGGVDPRRNEAITNGNGPN